MAGLTNPLHLAFIAMIALIFLGPKRLPELAKSLGSGMREFRETLSMDHHKDEPTHLPAAETPAPIPAAAAPVVAATAVPIPPAPAPGPPAPTPEPPAPTPSPAAPVPAPSATHSAPDAG